MKGDIFYFILGLIVAVMIGVVIIGACFISYPSTKEYEKIKSKAAMLDYIVKKARESGSLLSAVEDAYNIVDQVVWSEKTGMVCKIYDEEQNNEKP